MDIKKHIRNIPDFPEKGVQFKDVSTLLKNGEAFHEVVDMLVDSLDGYSVDLLAGPEARGFLFGSPLAYAMNIGFVIARKPGKLPGETERYEYELEYGTDALEIHKDAILPGQKIVIIDDLLATGGTSLAVAKLVEQMGGEVLAMRFVIELNDLGGREILKDYDIKSLIEY